MRSYSSLIDHYDRLIVVEILHRLVKEDGCVSGVIKKDGVVTVFSRRNQSIARLHSSRRTWSFVVVFHGRHLCHDSEPRQLLPGLWNTDVRSTMPHRLKEVVESAVRLR
jgi:hypothetical protein